MVVAVQLFVPGKYFAPVLKGLPPSLPPQMIITVPVHTAVWLYRRSGHVSGARSCPTIRARIVSSTRCSPQYRHLLRPRQSFHCRSIRRCVSLGQRVRCSCWSPSNCLCRDCICRRCSTGRCYPIRPRQSFGCRSTPLCDRFAGSERWLRSSLSNCPCRDLSPAGP